MVSSFKKDIDFRRDDNTNGERIEAIYQKTMLTLQLLCNDLMLLDEFQRLSSNAEQNTQTVSDIKAPSHFLGNS